MRRLQLYDRGKHHKYKELSSGSHEKTSKVRDGDRKSEKERIPSLHLFNLPKKILDQILGSLDTKTLLSLCLVNSRLYFTITNEFLYNNVVLNDKLALLKFNALLHCEPHAADALKGSRPASSRHNVRFLIRSVEFVRPLCQDSLLKYGKYCNNSEVSMIGGSYSYSNGPTPSSNNSMHALSTPLSRVASRESLNSVSSRGSIEQERKSGSRRHSRSFSPKPSRNISQFLESSTSASLLSKMEAKYADYTYIELMLDIIDCVPNLSRIILSEVQPGFRIPLWYSVLNDGSREFFKKIIKGQQSMNRDDIKCFKLSSKWISDYEEKFYSLPRFKTLEVRAAQDKVPVYFRANLLCCFGVFDELILENLVVDTQSLDTPLEYLPLYMKKSDEGFLDLHLPAASLTLDGCEIVPGNGIMKLIHGYFNRVKNLKLLNLKSMFDLLLSNCFPNIKDLTIDCNSKCFKIEELVSDDYYLPDNSLSDDDASSITETLINVGPKKLVAPPPTSAVVLSMNLGFIKRVADSNNKKPAMLTYGQSQSFKSMRIPEFHFFYHYFKNIWDRIPCQNINIRVVNIPFTNVFPLQPSQFWRQLLDCQQDDQQTLCGVSSDDGENFFDLPYWWNSFIEECHEQSLRSRYPGLLPANDINEEDIDPQLFNNFPNAKLFKDIPNINVWCFLKSLSKFKSVEIKMLRKWLFCTPRTRYDWELLLKPVLNGQVPVTVRDNDGYVLYKYGNPQNKQKSNSH